jgi:hypothetical protein
MEEMEINIQVYYGWNKPTPEEKNFYINKKKIIDRSGFWTSTYQEDICSEEVVRYNSNNTIFPYTHYVWLLMVKDDINILTLDSLEKFRMEILSNPDFYVFKKKSGRITYIDFNYENISKHYQGIRFVNTNDLSIKENNWIRELNDREYIRLWLWKSYESTIWLKWVFDEPIFNKIVMNCNHEIINSDCIKLDDLVRIKELNELDELDKIIEGKVRREQKILREYLFKGKDKSNCSICGREFPINFLVAGHIKKRAKCSKEEKLDYRNIVMPVCKFGCDELYEQGYVSVKNGKVVIIKEIEELPNHIKQYINEINGNICEYWNDQREKYFEWHYRFHTNLLD